MHLYRSVQLIIYTCLYFNQYHSENSNILVICSHEIATHLNHRIIPDLASSLSVGHINSCSTSSDHLLIEDLTPDTVYTVVVEARRKQLYKALDGEYTHTTYTS